MEPQATALLTDPMAVFAFLAGIVALVFWLSGLPKLRGFFEVVPPVIFVYFVPMLTTTAGITPGESPLYDWTVPYLLLFALLLLMVSVDVRSILKLGPMALFMVAAGTVGIIVGGPVSLLIFQEWLPADAWTGFAALSGSWIGGTANMVAIAESVGTSADAMGPVIVVDTVVGYGWMGVLIALVGLQHRYDKRTRARTEAVEETNRRLEALGRERRALTIRDAVIMIGLGMACAVLAAWAGGKFPSVGEPTIISSTTWAVLIVVTGGLILSFTPVAPTGDGRCLGPWIHRPLPAPGRHRRAGRPEGGPGHAGLPAGGGGLDCNPCRRPASCRPHRPRTPLLRGDGEHGQHRRRGLCTGRRGGVPPVDGAGRAAHGGRGVHPRDLRGAGVCVAAGAGGRVSEPTP